MKGLKMSWKNSVWFIFLSGCTTPAGNMFRGTPHNPDLNSSQPPPLVDPLNVEHIKDQPHIIPYFIIVALTLAICFIPFAWTKSQAQRYRFKDWIKKKLDKKTG